LLAVVVEAAVTVEVEVVLEACLQQQQHLHQEHIPSRLADLGLVALVLLHQLGLLEPTLHLEQLPQLLVVMVVAVIIQMALQQAVTVVQAVVVVVVAARLVVLVLLVRVMQVEHLKAVMQEAQARVLVAVVLAP
jgi:hypothetical protein